MTLVKTVTGPRTALVGDRLRYRVTEFIPARPSNADIAAVSWLVKSEGASALASVANGGPEFTITVPNTWAGQNVLVMPFMRAPSTAVSVTTAVADADIASSIALTGEAVTVRIERDNKRYYAAVDAEPRFFLGVDVTYGDQANAALTGMVLSLTPYETPDLSVAWRCGSAAVPAGAPNPLGTAGGGTTAAYAASTVIDKYMPKSCRA